MSLLDKFKKNKDQKPTAKKAKEPSQKAKDKVGVAKKSEPKEAAITQSTSQPSKIKAKNFKNAYRVLIKPVVSEKATYLGVYNSYVFEVAKEINKIEIKKAISSLYGVEPLKVRVVNVSGKDTRYGKTTGRTKDWKKAIVTLRPGDKIQVYEGI